MTQKEENHVHTIKIENMPYETETENESIRTEPNRTEFYENKTNRTELEPLFKKLNRTEPNRSEPEKVGSIRSLI